jgi:acyl-CoA reductase-like NAD-dependent aldehyde dehydrogenase
MEWTKPLSVALSLVVAALAAGGAVVLARNTLGGGESVTAAGVLAFLVAALLGAVALGAKSGRWLSNPDSYW